MKKGLIIGLVSVVVLGIAGVVVYLKFFKDKTEEYKAYILAKIDSPKEISFIKDKATKDEIKTWYQVMYAKAEKKPIDAVLMMKFNEIGDKYFNKE